MMRMIETLSQIMIPRESCNRPRHCHECCRTLEFPRRTFFLIGSRPIQCLLLMAFTLSIIYNLCSLCSLSLSLSLSLRNNPLSTGLLGFLLLSYIALLWCVLTTVEPTCTQTYGRQWTFEIASLLYVRLCGAAAFVAAIRHPVHGRIAIMQRRNRGEEVSGGSAPSKISRIQRTHPYVARTFFWHTYLMQ